MKQAVSAKSTFHQNPPSTPQHLTTASNTTLLPSFLAYKSPPQRLATFPHQSRSAVETTVHLAVSICIHTNTALTIVAVLRLRSIFEENGLRVNTPNLDIKDVRELAVNTDVLAAWYAQQGDSAYGILDGVFEGNSEAVVDGPSAGALGTFVLLVLGDVHTAPAASKVRRGACRDSLTGSETWGVRARVDIWKRRGSERQGCEEESGNRGMHAN